jgi:hypothetical protein
VIIGVSGLAVSTLSYVPMFNSLKVLFMKLGFGMSFNCLTSVEIKKKRSKTKNLSHGQLTYRKRKRSILLWVTMYSTLPV